MVRVNGKKIYDYKKHVKRVRDRRCVFAGARSSSPLNMCAYRVVCLPQIKNYKKESFVDLDVSTHNLRVRGNVKLMFFDYDAMSADDKVGIACIQTPWSGV